MKNTCATCRWWDTSVSDGRYQEFSPCRVAAPVVGLGSNRAIWPMVEGEDWCGRHAPPPPPEPRKCPDCGLPPIDCSCIPF